MVSAFIPSLSNLCSLQVLQVKVVSAPEYTLHDHLLVQHRRLSTPYLVVKNGSSLTVFSTFCFQKTGLKSLGRDGNDPH